MMWKKDFNPDPVLRTHPEDLWFDRLVIAPLIWPVWVFAFIGWVFGKLWKLLKSE